MKCLYFPESGYILVYEYFYNMVSLAAIPRWAKTGLILMC